MVTTRQCGSLLGEAYSSLLTHVCLFLPVPMPAGVHVAVVILKASKCRVYTVVLET